MKGCASFVVGGWPQPDAALKELIAKYRTREAFLVASVYALQNQRDEAFERLAGVYWELRKMNRKFIISHRVTGTILYYPRPLLRRDPGKRQGF